MIVTTALLVIFLIHLVAFVVVGLRRRQAYYAALVVTFALLSASMAARLLTGDAGSDPGLGIAAALRYAAWVAAAVSITWTLARIRARVVQRRANAG